MLTIVREEMLKHASEEFRHAHHLKRQIQKVSSNSYENYSLNLILGDKTTVNYLNHLDLELCGYLRKNFGLVKEELKIAAYYFVTYAIELRAQELYPLYHTLLRNNRSKVSVKAICLEEEEHLEEMKRQIDRYPLGWIHAEMAVKIESDLCQKWLIQIDRSLSTVPV